MAYPPHHLLVFGGTLNVGAQAGGEIWQCGIRVTGVGDTEDDTLAAIGPRLLSWFSGQVGNMRSDSKLTFIKLNAIGPEGRYVNRGTTHVTFVGNPPSGATASSVPNFLSLAFSWTTDKPRGLAHTGRIYPPFALVDSNTARAGGTDVTKAVASAKALLTAVAPSGGQGTGAAPVVASAQGPLQTITGVRVGDVIDVQRRRKDKAKEAYSASTWP